MDLSPEKIMMLVVIGLVVMGPQRLPQVARTLGRAMAEVRKYRGLLQAELGNLLEEPRAAMDGVRQQARSVRTEVVYGAPPDADNVGQTPVQAPATPPEDAPDLVVEAPHRAVPTDFPGLPDDPNLN